MLSINDCQKTDRMWNIHCYAGLPTYGASYSISYWSSFFANDFFGKMKFQCGPNAVISGMGSVFSRIDKDRRYRFRCTHMRYYSKSACKWSDWLNDYNVPMSHHVPRNSYINGMESVQDPINRYVPALYTPYHLKLSDHTPINQFLILSERNIQYIYTIGNETCIANPNFQFDVDIIFSDFMFRDRRFKLEICQLSRW